MWFVYTCDENEEENVNAEEIRHFLDRFFPSSVLCDDECHGFFIYNKWSSSEYFSVLGTCELLAHLLWHYEFAL